MGLAGRESEHWLTNRKSGIYYAVGMSERAYGPDRRTFPRGLPEMIWKSACADVAGLGA